MDSSKSSLNPYATPFVPLSKTAATEDGNLGNPGAVVSVSTSTGHTEQVNNSGKISVESGPQDMLEKFDLVSDILCIDFPGLSKESIAEVFYINGCDLDGTINMLEDMEDLTRESEIPVCDPNTSGTVGVKQDA